MPSFALMGKPDFDLTGHPRGNVDKVTGPFVHRIFCVQEDDRSGYTNCVACPL